MKSHKIKICLLAAMILISSLLINPTRVRGEEYVPTFGVDIREIENAALVDGSPYGEAINYWVHYNALKWSEVERTKGVYSWNTTYIQALDTYLMEMNAADMEVILTINSTPDWARSHDRFCGPMDSTYIDEFAAFVAQTVSRYSQEPYSVEYYEIWNEPDSPFSDPEYYFGCWGDPYDPQGYFGGGYYGQMLKQVYPALKAASPDAQLVIGGLLLPADPNDPFWSEFKDGRNWVYSDMSKFFEGILDECQGYECFDFVNFHGYIYYGEASAIELERLAGTIYEGELYPFWPNGGQVEGKLDYLQDLMGENPKPIILTEAAILGDDIPDYLPAFEAVKADYIVYLYARNLARGIYATTWHHLDSYGWRRSGFLDWNNQPLPAYDAYKTLTTNLYGAVFTNEITYLGEGVIAFEFAGNTRYWVLFSEDGTTKQVTKPDWAYTVLDLFGGDDYYTISGSTISFSRPIYIKGNSPPKANNDRYFVIGDKLTIPAPGVLANDIDFDRDTLDAYIDKNPVNGTVTLNKDGSFTYQPSASFTETDTFTYKAYDGEKFSNVATVTLTKGNAAPKANNDSFIWAGSQTTIAAPGVLGNDTDADGDPLEAILVTNAVNGTVTLNKNGSFTYQPGANPSEIDTFTYKANDGQSDSNVATVTLTKVNSEPKANDDSFVLDPGKQYSISAPGVLGNDVDFDGDTLTAKLVKDGVSGKVTLNKNGSFTYQPNSILTKTDTFTYKANDGEYDSNVATVTLTISSSKLYIPLIQK